MKKVVILGGGTGTSFVVKGLKYFPIDLTCVITVSDDGSSTGRLRREFSTPAVGDIRKVLSNLSTLPDEVRDVMEYRLKAKSELNGHALGNLVLTSLIHETGSLQKSIQYLSKILDVKSTVLPLSEDYLTLMGETTDGDIIEGEEEITLANKKYKEFFYTKFLKFIYGLDFIILRAYRVYNSYICKPSHKIYVGFDTRYPLFAQSAVPESIVQIPHQQFNFTEIHFHIKSNSVSCQVIIPFA